MNWIWLVLAVVVYFVVMYFLNKKTFVSQIVKALEISAIAVLSLGIAFMIGVLFKKTLMGIVAVGITFYFFGGLIRPYIIQLVEKLTKNFGKKEDK